MRRRKGSSMRRTLGILQAVAAAERPITPTELNVGLGLPKPTIHRLCNMLVDEGFLQNSLHGKGLTAGLKLRQLAIDVVAHGGGRRAALHAILEAVAETVGETCNINVPDGNAMRYVDRVESRWPLRLQLPIGSRVPLHCTASGKAFLGSLPPARRRQVITNLALDRHTPNTITDRGNGRSCGADPGPQATTDRDVGDAWANAAPQPRERDRAPAGAARGGRQAGPAFRG
jgi:DNA-binding IclR family transcriptional regulator